MYDDSLVTTEFGPVRGRVVEGVHTFKGLRYGSDTGRHRFLPPLPPEPWTDPATAFAFGPTCPQDHPDSGTDRALNPFLQKIGLTDNLPESEDCLFCNVWTPGTQIDARRPVMVWVHSGAFASNSGSSPSIDGTFLAREQDVVVVTFNHRLNVLGYTQLSDDPASPFAASGNVGMLDIVAVLGWVARNIAAFGGDPDNVTLFGQSGGAMKISALLRMPSAAGLFHRAILSSGGVPRACSLASALSISADLAARLGHDRVDPVRLQAVALPDLMRAYLAIAGESGAMAFSAVEDGSVLPATPIRPETPGAGVPVIVGDLDTEATLFLSFQLPEIAGIERAGVVDRVARIVGASAAEALVAGVESARPEVSPYEILARIVSAGVFTLNSELVADDLASAGQPVWRYRITWRTPVDDGLLLSPHELDVALVFGNIETAAGLNGATPAAYELSQRLRTAWAAFARTGSPGSDWPPYTLDSRQTLFLAPEPSVAMAPDADELRAMRTYGTVEADWLGGALRAD